MIEYRSIADLNQTILRNLHRIPRDIDVVVGIPRSGLLVANIVALHLNLPLTDVEGLIKGKMLSSGKRLYKSFGNDTLKPIKKALILDDSIASGTQMRTTRAEIESANLSYELIYAVVYATRKSQKFVDIHMETVERRLFEWNIMHHNILKKSCIDIDGVLCRDPTPVENDDGDSYRQFLAEVEPFIIPTVEVDCLVTCRLEKYRAETEKWLQKHDVRYNELVMLDLPDMVARQKARCHAAFKADVFLKRNGQLFIESSESQAREIAARTGLPVYCVESGRIESSAAIYPFAENGRFFGNWLSRNFRRIASFPFRAGRRVLKRAMRNVKEFVDSNQSNI